MRTRAVVSATACWAMLVMAGCAPAPQEGATTSAPPAGEIASPPATATGDPSSTPSPSGSDTTPTWVPDAANGDFLAPVILGRPTSTSVTANAVPAVAMDLWYEYGAPSSGATAATAPQRVAAGVPVETLIDGLQPGTRYAYRLRYSTATGTASGTAGSFTTQRAPGTTFVFDIQGDSHPERVGKQFDANLYEQVLAAAAADQPDFYLTMGDDFSVDALKRVDEAAVTQLYAGQRRWLGLVGAPVFLVNGNHEQAALANLDGTAQNVAVWAQTARNAWFPQPAPDGFYTGDTEEVPPIGLLRDYYAFSWGDALFVVLDPYWHTPTAVDNVFGAGRGADGGGKGSRDPWAVTLGEAQYRWLEETLASSTAAHTFVFAHHVNGTGRGGIELADIGEWGDAAGLAAHRPGWEHTISELFEQHGVTIFFQGHDHLFARQQLGSVVYQTVPSPADPNGATPNASAYHSGDLLPDGGRLRVTVTTASVTVEYIRSAAGQPDEVAFSYTVP